MLRQILLLYYTAQTPDAPGWAKAKIYSALGYLVLPVDAVPDALPGGFTDDAAVIAAALAAVAARVTPAIKRKADQTLQVWFDPGSARPTDAASATV